MAVELIYAYPQRVHGGFSYRYRGDVLDAALAVGNPQPESPPPYIGPRHGLPIAFRSAIAHKKVLSNLKPTPFELSLAHESIVSERLRGLFARRDGRRLFAVETRADGTRHAVWIPAALLADAAGEHAPAEGQGETPDEQDTGAKFLTEIRTCDLPFDRRFTPSKTKTYVLHSEETDEVDVNDATATQIGTVTFTISVTNQLQGTVSIEASTGIDVFGTGGKATGKVENRLQLAAGASLTSQYDVFRIDYVRSFKRSQSGVTIDVAWDQCCQPPHYDQLDAYLLRLQSTANQLLPQDLSFEAKLEIMMNAASQHGNCILPVHFHPFEGRLTPSEGSVTGTCFSFVQRVQRIDTFGGTHVAPPIVISTCSGSDGISGNHVSLDEAGAAMIQTIAQALL